MDKHSDDDGQLAPGVSETEIHLAFQNAIYAFKASHTPAEYAEISSCKSSAELLKLTKQAATSLSHENDKTTTTTTTSADGGAGRGPQRVPQSVHNFCDAVSRLSLALEPYLTCIDTFVRANPEISALVWGTLQLIFKVSRPSAILRLARGGEGAFLSDLSVSSYAGIIPPLSRTLPRCSTK